MDINNEDFNIPVERRGRNRWMWWLFLVVGLFVICLLIWLFTAVSSDDVKQQEQAESEMLVPAQSPEQAAPPANTLPSE